MSNPECSAVLNSDVALALRLKVFSSANQEAVAFIQSVFAIISLFNTFPVQKAVGHVAVWFPVTVTTRHTNPCVQTSLLLCYSSRPAKP